MWFDNFESKYDKMERDLKLESMTRTYKIPIPIQHLEYQWGWGHVYTRRYRSVIIYLDIKHIMSRERENLNQHRYIVIMLHTNILFKLGERFFLTVWQTFGFFDDPSFQKIHPI